MMEISPERFMVVCLLFAGAGFVYGYLMCALRMTTREETEETDG